MVTPPFRPVVLDAARSEKAARKDLLTTFDGERRYLGRFSTALEAALHVARNLGPAWTLEIALFAVLLMS